MTAADPHLPRPCPLPLRLAAMAYDALLLIAVLFVATFAVLPLTGGQPVASGNLLYDLYLLAVAGLYFVFQWRRGGHTLGMRAWRLRVVAEDGGVPGWGACVVRYLAALACWLPAGLGFASGLMRADGAAWHDRISGTRLVVLPAPGRPA